jgi:hypothetical protein
MSLEIEILSDLETEGDDGDETWLGVGTLDDFGLPAPTY